MRPIGFSTGALALGDFRRALQMLSGRRVQAVELSALRFPEVSALIEAIPSLDLTQFRFVSLHAPSQFDSGAEAALCRQMALAADRGWPVILHPDAISDFGPWRELGAAVCIENMDKRKPMGRTVAELDRIFGELPEATFCFDIGHARQFDSTMTEAWAILCHFGSKLRQVHVSEVNTRSKHDPLSFASIHAFQEVAHLIPVEVPLILEAQIAETEIDGEIDRAREALPDLPNAMAA